VLFLSPYTQFRSRMFPSIFFFPIRYSRIILQFDTTYPWATESVIKQTTNNLIKDWKLWTWCYHDICLVGVRKTYEIIQSRNLCPDRDSNWTSPEYVLIALPLSHLVYRTVLWARRRSKHRWESLLINSLVISMRIGVPLVQMLSALSAQLLSISDCSLFS
jgi:hypothetical protein